MVARRLEGSPTPPRPRSLYSAVSVLRATVQGEELFASDRAEIRGGCIRRGVGGRISDQTPGVKDPAMGREAALELIEAVLGRSDATAEVKATRAALLREAAHVVDHESTRRDSTMIRSSA